MRRFTRAAVGAFAAVLALPASAGFSGEYTIVFYSGPTHERTGSECVTFTNTGNILGFPDSGTWNSSTVGDWAGNFIADGNVLRWYGTYSHGTGATNAYNKIINDVPGSGGFDEWNVSPAPITAVNDGTQRLKRGCRSHQPKHFGDPTH